MPFRHPDRSHDLATRIELEVRERLEEAIDYVCLEALVRERRARGHAAPAADNPDDRRAYTEHVFTLLRRLQGELATAQSADEPPRASPGAAVQGDEQTELIAVQVTLARRLPDYWQQFEAVCEAYLAGRPGSGSVANNVPSRGERSGLLARLLGRR